ncbi:hypothetical protein L6654_29980 [Bradyrhizobium sp. WYCCWR 13023]|uniref:Uncharacterized protein n=1 Tax=Bradyrhizobium zhengyangense TaxID=2911009 RepID=A0A9X1RIH7_9BRAD|nr:MULTISPECIES: hypothetical protein [Bradyrhizobium]MCG2630865.1 hypothetical protein [Bradyrhizobium zhengyangense]MCG2644484.1 hypothetical protein [Bradyrhizobium zhengyangense]MCG2672084.1 hypothetical protein [Bradyrhizobium zhengyangense]MDA9519654.1 hypothetical protein [Bradyrhizobium sp. CCBAU 11434]
MRPQDDPEAQQRDRQLIKAIYEDIPCDRRQRRDADRNCQDDGKPGCRKIDDENGGVEGDIEEGIFLQSRGAEVERIHRQHDEAHCRDGMLNQPAVEPF